MQSAVRNFTSAVASVAAFACVLGAGIGAATPGTARAPSDSMAGRPVIILVHGRGQLSRDTAFVRREWLRALRDGAASAGGLPALRDVDVRLAWYADALDPLTAASCDRAPVGPAADADAGTDFRALFAAAGMAITGALELMDERSRVEARALAGDLLFLGDSRRRCAAEQRLVEALAAASRARRPVVLVAYSFGSLLAYGHLHARAAEDSTQLVRELVTLGSLLGAPGARLFLLGDTTARPLKPFGVRRWTNVLDPRDGLAHAIPESVPSDSVDGTTRNVVTAPVGPGQDAHDVLRYLRDPAAARAVSEAWCAAYAPWAPTRPPAECGHGASRR